MKVSNMSDQDDDTDQSGGLVGDEKYKANWWT